MNYFTLVLLFISIILLLILVVYIHKTNKLFSDVLSRFENSAESLDKTQLTTYELERLEREEEFDKRINMLKEEVALQQKILHNPTVADELHPLVKNLPHNVIDGRRYTDDYVEVAN